MKLLLWNTAWASPRSSKGEYYKKFATSNEVDLICYTEVMQGLHPESGHLIESNADYGYENTKGKRKVSLWSSSPWEQVDDLGSEHLPGGRFISGISHGIRFVGVCIPWKDAHVRSGRKDREVWEDHISYLAALKDIVNGYLKENYSVCILGDYNQRIPRNRQPEHIYNQLYDLLSPDFETSTSGILDPSGKLLIDHISTARGLAVNIKAIHPKKSENGLNLSDHVGIVAELTHSKGD